MPRSVELSNLPYEQVTLANYTVHSVMDTFERTPRDIQKYCETVAAQAHAILTENTVGRHVLHEELAQFVPDETLRTELVEKLLDKMPDIQNIERIKTITDGVIVKFMNLLSRVRENQKPIRIRKKPCPVTVQESIRRAIGSSSRHLEFKLYTSHDLAYLAANRHKIREMPLNEETFYGVKNLWDHYTTPNEAFTALTSETAAYATRLLTPSGFPERWMPLPDEEQMYEHYYRRHNLSASYQSPAEIMSKLLLTVEPSQGNVVVLGTEDGQNILVARTPQEGSPREDPPEALENPDLLPAYAKRNYDMLHHPKGKWLLEAEGDKGKLNGHYSNLIEIVVIACRKRGIPQLLLYELLDRYGKDAYGMILEHFGAIKCIDPIAQEGIGSDRVNRGSRSLFESLGAAHACSYPDFVVRKVRNKRRPICAELTWHVRFAAMSDLLHRLRNEVAGIDGQILTQEFIMPLPQESGAHPSSVTPPES